MKAIDTGNDKVKKLCEVLQKDTLEPAKEEAARIVDRAHEEAKRIIEEAKRHAKELVEESKERIEQEKKVFETAVALSAKQAISALQQELEGLLLEKGLSQLVQRGMSDAATSAKLLDALIVVVKEAGLDGNLIAILPAHLKKEEVLSVISAEALQAITETKEEQTLRSGVKLKIQNQNLVLDFSGQAIKELLSMYVREDFRKRIFNA